MPNCGSVRIKEVEPIVIRLCMKCNSKIRTGVIGRETLDAHNKVIMDNLIIEHVHPALFSPAVNFLNCYCSEPLSMVQ